MRVLITGAGTGIGARSAITLAEAGHQVFATMREPDTRNSDRAAALVAQTERAKGELAVVELDVLSDDSAQHAIDTVVERAGGIDVVIHNAAHLFFGPTEAFTSEQLLASVDVNAVGAHRVNRAALPVMRRQESGLLLWIGSGTTKVIPPFLGPYTIGKMAMDALAESTAWDVGVYGIETTILMPGVFTQGTEHFAKAASPDDEQRSADYDRIAPFLASSAEDTERLMVDGISADPQIVADEVLRIVDLPVGMRPFHAVADGSDYGAEIVAAASDELRHRLARRMHITPLLERTL